MMFLSRAFRPLVWLLSSSTDLVLKLLHVRRSAASVISDEEIKVMMEQGSEHGVFHENEQEIVSNVLRLDDQRVSAIMTPRMALYGIDLSAPENVIRERVAESPFNRLVVYRNGLENIVGIVEKGALLKELLQGRSLDIESALKPAVFVPESVTTAQLLDNLQGTHMRIALIIDEYGTLRGLVSMTDVLTAIIGDLAVTGEPAVDEARQREDGSWLLDGAMSLERFGNLPGIDASEEEVDDNVHTLGGYAMTRLGRIPVVGDRFEAMGLRFEVVDMDRNRVDKVLVTPLPRQDPPGEQ
jgi:putative hemolysin